jgi:Cys-tRNA(Pro) deacylase|tara:strand:+ start:663 stop:1145 length:483 start_codon:yes stop_codon:yes gene_type:complete
MNSILNKEPVKRAEKALKEFDNDLNIECLENTARTANDAATALGCKVGAIVKSLLFRTEHSFVLCLVSGDKKCSLNKLKKILDEKDVSMANAEQVKKITGYTIGGVSPVGHLTKVNILIDKNLNRFNDIFAAAGHPNCIFKINFEKLIGLTNGKVEELTE